MTIEDIKQKFPNPVTSALADSGVGAYCVGGAICRSVDDIGCPFPAEMELSNVLRGLNPNLSIADSVNFAEDIIFYNDNSNFSAAWRKAEEALCKGNDNV